MKIIYSKRISLRYFKHLTQTSFWISKAFRSLSATLVWTVMAQMRLLSRSKLDFHYAVAMHKL